jgi:NADPH:quinone reductase-like Zn-dependent oxidoreductase
MTSVVPERTAPSGDTAVRPAMRAVLQVTYGTGDAFSLGEIARPSIDEREVLVRVAAAGMDRGTWHLMAGLPYPVRMVAGLRRPKHHVPGLDLAGTVESVGSAVTRFGPGDEVFGIGRGSFAEYAPAREDKLARKPASLSFEQAAATAVSGLTALRGLCEVGRLQAGQHVLITGASGGVGTFAVQIAKAMGARVTGVCSTSKVDLVRSIGADDVIDYTREDFADREHEYDLILDIGGTPSLSRLRRALTSRGTAVIAGGEAGGRWLGGTDRQLRALALSPFVSQRLTTFVNKEHFAGLERLGELADRGLLVPVIERTYPLAETPSAMRHLVAGQARGKLVIIP